MTSGIDDHKESAPTRPDRFSVSFLFDALLHANRFFTSLENAGLTTAFVPADLACAIADLAENRVIGVVEVSAPTAPG